MKLKRTNKRGYVFELAKREKRLLLDTLKLYPLVPAAHHRLTKSSAGENHDEDQRLLEESLAEQRRENRRQLESMLAEPERFRETESGFQFTLSSAQVEWLLQVLNDVRVGSWLALGEPDEHTEPEVTPKNVRYVLALEICGHFQSELLAALGVEQSAHWS